MPLGLRITARLGWNSLLCIQPEQEAPLGQSSLVPVEAL